MSIESIRRVRKSALIWLLCGTIIGGLAARARADSFSTGFEPGEGYSTGSIDGQQGWGGQNPPGIAVNVNIDQGVTTAPVCSGSQSYRESSSFTTGSFGDQVFSPSLTDEAGESAPDAKSGSCSVTGSTACNVDGDCPATETCILLSSGVRQNSFSATINFASATGAAQNSHVVISPDRGDGARMSWIQISDNGSNPLACVGGPENGDPCLTGADCSSTVCAPDGRQGLSVSFFEYRFSSNPNTECSGGVAGQDGQGKCFVFSVLATNLSRTGCHQIDLTMNFYDGPANDRVLVSVDGGPPAVRTSWEDFFRNNQAPGTRTVDSLLFRVAGAQEGSAGGGFIFDDVSYASGPIAPTCDSQVSCGVGATPCGNGCICLQPVGTTPGVGAGQCADTFLCVDNPFCAQDSDCPPNLPICYQTGCSDPNDPNICPAPRCGSLTCTPTTTTTSTTVATTTTTSSTSSTTSTTNTTLQSSCGNAIIEVGEQCDPPNQPSSACGAFGGTTCGPNCQCLPTTTTTSTVTTSSSSTTSSTTTSSTSSSTTTSSTTSTTNTTLQSSCGDAIIEVGEQCDPPNLPSSACGAFGGTTCGPNCQCVTTTTSTSTTSTTVITTTSTSLTTTSTSTTSTSTTVVTTTSTSTSLVTTTSTSTTTTTLCSPTPENTSAACGDMIDNDCDGLTDCQDPDCSGIFPCPRASKDPTIIAFGHSGKLDRIRGHAKLLATSSINIAALPVSVLLSDLHGPIYSDGLTAGSLSTSPNGAIFLFRNPAAKTAGGMYEVKIKKNNDGSYTFSFTSYGDLSGATDSHMRLQFYIGTDANAAAEGRIFITTDHEWSKTPHGWRAPKDH